jgi:hypothetical protein
MNYWQKQQLSINSDLTTAIKIALTNWAQKKLLASKQEGTAALSYLDGWAVDQIIRNPKQHVERFARFAVLSIPDELLAPIAAKNMQDAASMAAFDAAITALDGVLDTLSTQYIPIFAERLAPPEPVEESA